MPPKRFRKSPQGYEVPPKRFRKPPQGYEVPPKRFRKLPQGYEVRRNVSAGGRRATAARGNASARKVSIIDGLGNTSAGKIRSGLRFFTVSGRMGGSCGLHELLGEAKKSGVTAAKRRDTKTQRKKNLQKLHYIATCIIFAL